MSASAALETAPIPGTGLNPSRIGLRTAAIGGWMSGDSDEAEFIRTIHAALDRGITLIDTAPAYGFGRSEEIVGKALSQRGLRHRVSISTKAGLDWMRGKPFRSASKAGIANEVEDSLRRLRTDVIDLYQVHWPDPAVPMEETAEAMARLLQAGKIRAIGVGNFSCDQMDAFRAVAPLHTARAVLNMFERDSENAILPYCGAHRIVTLVDGALCRGLLSGRITVATRLDRDDPRRRNPKFRAPRLHQYLNAVATLDRFAQANYRKRVVHLALRWALDLGGITLWGARQPHQLDPISEVSGWHIDRAAMAEIDRILAACIVDPVGPERMAPPDPLVTSQSRHSIASPNAHPGGAIDA